jgi:hypothetical protein
MDHQEVRGEIQIIAKILHADNSMTEIDSNYKIFKINKCMLMSYSV